MKNPFRVTLTKTKRSRRKRKESADCRTRKHRIHHHHHPHPLRRPPPLLRPSFSGVVLLLQPWFFTGCKLLEARVKFLSIVGDRGCKLIFGSFLSIVGDRRCKLIFGSSQCMLMMILLVAEGANAASALIYFESSLHLLDGFKHQSRRNLR
ncbi:hypothetical protein Hanom_Chr12g01120091 [Helianthus anomalus]